MLSTSSMKDYRNPLIIQEKMKKLATIAAWPPHSTPKKIYMEHASAWAGSPVKVFCLSVPYGFGEDSHLIHPHSHQEAAQPHQQRLSRQPGLYTVARLTLSKADYEPRYLCIVEHTLQLRWGNPLVQYLRLHWRRRRASDSAASATQCQ